MFSTVSSNLAQDLTRFLGNSLSSVGLATFQGISMPREDSAIGNILKAAIIRILFLN